ncbi:MAG TPA: hypothetical protein PKK94_14355 [Leptospiraceae bacterium]|nr:hypothetical protein [Leptospiraceae bacterium]
MSVKKEKLIKVGKWTEGIHNSNEKRIKKLLKEILPDYKEILWDEASFQRFYIEVLNSLPSRYKQKNSIELNGRLKEDILKEAIIEKLEEMEEQILLESSL